MGSGGVPSGGVTRVDGRRGDLEKIGKANSRYDLYVNGEKVQSRWYDWQGRVIHNRDYSHSDNGGKIKFPHDHWWEWIDGEPYRSVDHDAPDYFNYPETD